MSKIEAGMMELYPENFELAVCLQSIKDILAIAAEKKGLELTVELSDRLPKMFCLDEGKLKQILINLVNNAIKFTDQGSVLLRISSLDQLETIHIVRFEVIDTGVGMDKTELSSLFQAFQQTKSGQQSKQGTGLGLAISQSFVHLLGGQIQVESRKGQGSRFWFDLKVDLPSIYAETLTESGEELKLLPEKGDRH